MADSPAAKVSLDLVHRDIGDVRLTTREGEPEVVIHSGDDTLMLTRDELRWLLLTAGPAALGTFPHPAAIKRQAH